MKKKFLIFGIAFIILATFFITKFVKNYCDNLPKELPNGTVVYDFKNQSQPRARKILYKDLYDYYFYYPSGKQEKIL